MTFEDRNIEIQKMLDDCIYLDSQIDSLREAFARGEGFTKQRVREALIAQEQESKCRMSVFRERLGL